MSDVYIRFAARKTYCHFRSMWLMSRQRSGLEISALIVSALLLRGMTFQVKNPEKEASA
jgi:hypothetical protein